MTSVAEDSESPNETKRTRDQDKKIARLTKSLARLFPHRPRRDCDFCCETKLNRSFKLRLNVLEPCRSHLANACTECIQASLSSQLDSKALLSIGCPTCSAIWDFDLVRRLLGRKDKRRFDELDILAKNRGLTPEQLPELATLNEMLEKGTRFCPWCRFPFVKEGGCDYMTCSSCYQGFTISYALVLEDGEGRRAADLPDEFLDLDF